MFCLWSCGWNRYYDIIEELLFFKSILSGTKDLFDVTNNFMDHNNIIWENCLTCVQWS